MKKWILLAAVIIIYAALACGVYRHYQHSKAVTPTASQVQQKHDDAVRADQKATDNKKTAAIVDDYNKLHAECLKGASTTALYNALTTVKVKAPAPVCGTELLQ